MRVLAVDLFCGLGGWSEGLLACGYYVVGFDVERHEYGDHRYPAQLVLQDVTTIHGSQFKDAALIVASPPCQEFSYMAMPWSRAKQIARALRGEDEFPEGYTGSRTVAELTTLLDACFRIQREASEAAGRHIPLVVENVRGAQPWIGRSAWNYGSFHLWGDVPALMPMVSRLAKAPGQDWNRYKETGTVSPDWKMQGTNNTGGSWFNVAHNTTSGKGRNPDGRKQPGLSGTRENGKGDRWFQDGAAEHGSKSPARKAASALIAKIPFELAVHIGRVYAATRAA